MEDTPIIVNVIKINARYFLYKLKFNMDDIIIFTDLFSDFFSIPFKIYENTIQCHNYK